MSAVNLPLRDDLPHFAFQVELEGATYGFDFYWNTRDNGWQMNVRDNDGTLIVAGRRVVVDYPLLANIVDDRLPPGTLVAFDTTGRQEDPGEFDLGSRVVIIYFDSTEEF